MWNVKGDATTLLSEGGGLSSLSADGQFEGMFKGVDVADASRLVLPSDVLSPSCYADMFSGCANLWSAPNLPAMTLADNCYTGMFEDCTSLTAGPELPATSIRGGSYMKMFKNSGIVSVPVFYAQSVSAACFDEAFAECQGLQSTGRLSFGSYSQNMCNSAFKGCSSLTAAEIWGPDDPDSYGVSAYRAFYAAFDGCVSLSSVKVPWNNWGSDSNEQFTSYWLRDVALTGTMNCPSALGTSMTITRGIHNCPEGWDVSNTQRTYLDYVTVPAEHILDLGVKFGLDTSLSTELRGDANGAIFIGTNLDENRDCRFFNAASTAYFDLGSRRINRYNGWNTSTWNQVSVWNYGMALSMNGGPVMTTTGTRFDTVQWVDRTLSVGGVNYFDLRGISMWDNGALIRDWRPVEQDGVVGLFDEVQGVFYQPISAWTAPS